MGRLVDVKIDLGLDLERALKANEKRISEVMAATIQTNRGLLFANEGAHNGHAKWAPLKWRDGQILADTGALKNSIAPKIPPGSESPGTPGRGGYIEYSGDIRSKTVVVGTEIKYANTHDKGAVIKPVTKQVLRFRGPGGKGWVFARSVTIPRREFTGWNEQDTEELEQTLKNLIEQIISETVSG